MGKQRHMRNTHVGEKDEGIADSRAVNAPANAVSPQQRERVRIHLAWCEIIVSERECRLIYLCARTSERASLAARARARARAPAHVTSLCGRVRLPRRRLSHRRSGSDR